MSCWLRVSPKRRPASCSSIRRCSGRGLRACNRKPSPTGGEPPPLSVSLYLGGVWLRHAFRGRRWGASLVDAYWAVLRAELDAVVAQLEHIEPAEGPKHLVQVWLSAEYWSQVGQRLGASVIQELERRTQDWLFLAKAKNVVLEIGVTAR